MFQQLLSQKEDGEEFARILLSTILGKTIRKVKITPQKSILGIDTDKHGIRLDAYIEDLSDKSDDTADAEIIPDIYDLEPNNTYEKETLPKRIRYYHSLIDTQFLSSGYHYLKMPKIVIIVILPYDPFDQNRMVYTVQNQCIEDQTIPYDDGAQKIFLYTKGTEGNPSQTLKDMLKYIETTTAINITNKDIASIQHMVDKVKRKKEVNISYMKSWEIEQMAKDEGYNEGYNEGYSEGYDVSLDRVNQLIIKLTNAGRNEDILKSAQDKEYQEQLFKEFNL